MGIFEPYRAIGYIAGNVPFSVQRLGTETFVTVSIGKAFQVYNCAKLNLVISGPQLPKKIRALACYREFTFAAYGKHIAVVRRAHLVATCNGHSSKINQLLVFGDYLISTDIKGSVYIWPFKGLSNSISPVGHICLESSFTPSCLMHPDTYLNKVVIGSQEGSFQLWNISTKKKLYDFKGWDSAICCCVASPALHVVALGCADGKVHVHNIYTDEKLFTFAHSTRGAVTALSFCTDGRPLLASGDSSGVMCLWNLEKNRLHSVIGDAHNGSIISLYFFPREPVLMSSSADNSIKMWIFDTSDGDARLLRFRSGHSAPPLCIKFYANGRHILSAGQDRAFRLFSIIQDQQSKELSQRHISKRAKKLKLKDAEIKLKPVIAFDVAEIRERDWCNVVTCHLDTAKAYVWRLQNFVIGEHILSPCPGNSKPAKSCAISACGNFAIIGNAGGWIERFNLQSGISRGSYVDKSGGKLSAHEGEVVGIACDSTNTILISAGFHGDIKVWDFKKQTLKFRMETGCTLVKIVYHRYNGLLAVMADDLLIRLFDVVAQRIVRKFEGHTDRITDACFSEDGKWFLTSGMDSTVRVWDLILARVIDVLNVDVPVIALSLSPGMDILATAHVDQNGIYLWVNQEMFSVPNKAGSYGRIKEDASSLDESTEMQDDPSLSVSCDHLLDLVTLSMLPKTQWQSLINLDLIKARNKPIEPPKKPEKTPFFLPSIPSLSGDIVFKPVVPAEDEEDKQNTELEKKQEKRDFAVTQFLQLLESSSREGNFATFTDYVKGLSASSLDMEFRMLQIIDDVDEEDLVKRPETHFILLLMEYFIQEISRGSNFEFIQAQIRLFLTIHGETIRRQAVVRDKAQKLLEIHSAVWQKLDKMFQSARCTMTFLSNSQF